MQNEDQIKALPNPFGAELEYFPDPDQLLPVSVAHSESKLMTVKDIKAMSWEEHLNMWKVLLVGGLPCVLASCRE